MKVNLYATFRSLVGAKTVEVPAPEGSSVVQLLQVLVEQYPVLDDRLLGADGQLQSHVHVFVNGRAAAHLPEGFESPLTVEDQVDIFPPVAGG